MKTSVVLLAAGFSSRFAGNKLLYEIENKPLIAHMMDKVTGLPVHRVVVVSQYEEVRQLCETYGFLYVSNNNASEGLSASLKKGVETCFDDDQILFLVADQLYLKKVTLLTLLEKGDGRHIVCSSYKGSLRNPMLFPKRYYEELLALAKEEGGKQVAKRHSVLTVETDARQLYDIDTKDDIKQSE